MRLTFLTMLMMCALSLVGQITNYPHTQDFEQVFTTGTDIAFIAHWRGNTVATRNRIFQGTDGRSNSSSLNVIPTSTFTGEILISLDMSALPGGKFSFYAFSKENGSTSTRPSLLYISTSNDGGKNFTERTQIGDETTFPNDDSTNFSQYSYALPSNAGGSSEVVVKIEVARGPGSGSAAELVFDDFLIEEDFPPLDITNVQFENNNHLSITFNQALEPTSAKNTQNYQVNFGYGKPISAIQDPNNGNIVTLTYPKNFVNNTYTIEVNNVQNTDGDSLKSALNFSAKNETPTGKRQIIINEIYADPTGDHAPNPAVLPNTTNAEFIELYNPGVEAIEITDFKLSGALIDQHTLAAKAYVIITAPGNVNTYGSFGQTITVDSWNTLSNGGEQILLHDQLGNLVDSLSYSLDWYQDDLKSQGGWSIEHINPNLTCSGASNWSSSAADIGGTPGQVNSIFDESPDQVAPLLDTIIVNSPRSLTVIVDELMDKAQLIGGNYELLNGPSVISALPRSSLKAVDITLGTPMTSGTFYQLVVDGLTDCAGNALIQNKYTFLFDNQAPVLERIIFKSTEELHLIFNEPLISKHANDEDNYAIDNGIGRPKTSRQHNNRLERVALEFDQSFQLNSVYNLRINGLQDSLGNQVINDTRDFVFSNNVDTVIVISEQLLDVYFDQAVAANTIVPSNFAIAGLGEASAAILDRNNDQLVHLTFQSSFRENRVQSLQFEDIKSDKGPFLQLLNTNFIYDTDDPDLVNFEILNEKQLQLNFDEVLDQTSAEIVNHYSVNNGIGSPKTVERINDRTAVILSFEQSFPQETSNRITYTNIQDLSGNAICANRRFDFTFDTQPPQLDSLHVLSPTQLLLSFSEELTQKTAEDVNNYSINNGIGQPIIVERLDSAQSWVFLTFNSLGNSHDHELTISNISDTLGNVLTDTFSKNFDNITPDIGSFLITSDSSFRIQFTKNLTQASAEDQENYGFDHGDGALEIILDSTNASVVDILLTKRLKENITYHLVVDSLEDEFGNFLAASSHDFQFNNFINDIDILSPTSLRIRFDQALYEPAAEMSTNYQIIEEIGSPISTILNPNDPRIVTLVFSKSLQESLTYTLKTQDLETEKGALIPLTRTQFIYDLRPPEVLAINPIFDDELEVTYNERLDPTTALALNHYSLNNGIGHPIEVKFSNETQTSVILKFSSELIDAKDYLLTIERVEDRQGKAMAETTLSFTFQAPIIPRFRQIVINEIYFDVDENSDLPAHEFIELFNLHSEPFRLRDFMLTDRRDTAYFQDMSIGKEAFLVLSNANGAKALNGASLTNFPALSNAGETIFLIDRKGSIIDSLVFNKQLYQDENKEDGGYTVELVNPFHPCFDSSNYVASNDPTGGTPGRQNSTFSNASDLSPPQILAVAPIDTTKLLVQFNEAMDIASLIPASFSIASGIQVESVEINDPFWKTIRLTLAQPFAKGYTQLLEVTSVRDCVGNSMNQCVPFALGSSAGLNDLLVTEIMATPTPDMGIPEVEYIEIYNNSERLIALKDVYLVDNSVRTRIGDFNIPSKMYLILCKNNNVSELESFGEVLGVNSFPSLTTEDEVRLEHPDSTLIFGVSYDRSFYKEEDKQNGGYSMEMINLNPACESPDNWRASSDPSGGTPGRQNSTFSNASDLSPPEILIVTPLDTTELLVQFNEVMDIASLIPANFSIASGIQVESVEINDSFGKSIRLILAQPFAKGYTQLLEVTSVRDCAGNSMNELVPFALGSLAGLNDLLITEIMATPTPDMGIPEVEYIEIFNNTDRLIGLKDVYLADNLDRTLIGDFNIDAKAYLILCKNSSVPELAPFGDVMGVNNFPTLTVQDEVRLEYADSTLIFNVLYNKSFYKSEDKQNDGYSLEMINPNPACQSPDNWRGSSDPRGGTPGKQNAVYSTAQDKSAPKANSFEVLSDTSFLITFNEAMNTASFQSSNIQFQPSLSISDVEALDSFGYHMRVMIDAPFTKGILHHISFQGVADCNGNPLKASFEFAEGRTPLPYELIISELMADPTPSNGLPESEYVEIYNRSNQMLSLNQVVLADEVSSTVLPDTIILPNSYLLLVPNSNKQQFGSNTIGLNNWPNLNGDKETLRLFNHLSEELFRVSYTDEWYRSSLKAKGGFSLEMIDTDYPCVQKPNWSATTAQKGGTPGKINAISGNNPDKRGPQLLQGIQLDPGTIELHFSERLDRGSLDVTDFSIDNHQIIAFQLDPTEHFVTLYTDSDLIANRVYTITVENLTDCTGNLIDQDHSRFTLIVPGEAEIGDLLLNEVLFNPRSGGARFVECYNQSSKYINLKNWRIAGLTNNRFITEEDLFIGPNQYLAITNDLVNIQAEYPTAKTEVFVEVNSMPSMGDDAGAVIILNMEGIEIDRFDYSEDYHTPLLSDKEGVSLERLSLSGNSNDPNNWFSASSSTNYATPGYTNSQRFSGEATSDILSISPSTFSPDVTGLADFTTLSFTFDYPGNVLNITIFDASGNLIRRLSENKLIGNKAFFTWDGTMEDGSRARIGYYMILAEIISAHGKVDYVKGKVAIGGRF